MWYETIVKCICSSLLDFCEFLDFVLLCLKSGMKSGMETRQQSYCKNCSPLDRSCNHESARESGNNTKACLEIEVCLTVVVYICTCTSSCAQI